MVTWFKARLNGVARAALPGALSVLVFCLSAFGWNASAQEVLFTASLDRPAITVGETATLSLTFNGGGPQDPPAVPSIPGLQIQYLGPSSQTTIINGQVSSTVTHVYTVTARQPGDFTIPALTAAVGNKQLQSAPLTLKVLKPGAPSQGAIDSGTQVAFMKLVLPKSELYAGEVVPAELQLYLRQDVQAVRGFQVTSTPADGFDMGKMVEAQANRRRVQVGNAVYTIIPLSFTLRATRPGSFNLGPVTATVVVDLPAARQRRRAPWSDFGFGMFDQTEQRQVALATETTAVSTLPLPSQNVPPGFNGAVGAYTLSATVGPTNVAVGDPITLKVQLTGRGALENINLPEQLGWTNFKAYPPTAKTETTDTLGLQGTKRFEQTLVPASADVKELPPLRFSYFDPDQKTYRTLVQPAIALLVRPAGSVPTPTIALRSDPETQQAPRDIVHIKPRLGVLAQAGPPLILRPWFMFLQSLPVLAWVGAIARRKRADNLANNPKLRRKRAVAQLVKEGLAQLRQLASDNKSDEFFATLVRLLQEQLGERLDRPASGITEAVIEEDLRPRHVAEPLLSDLRQLFDSCNLARYAPAQSSQQLAALIPTADKVLHELRILEL